MVLWKLQYSAVQCIMEGQQAGIVEDLFLLCICICPARCALYSLLLYGGVAVEEFIVQPQQERPAGTRAL